MHKRTTIWDVIFWPAVITLVVTMARLGGELAGGSPLLFNAEPGGGLALVGIAWLVPVFGIYFAWKLTGLGKPEVDAGRLVAYSLVALLILIGLAVINFSIFEPGTVPSLIIFGIVSVVSMWIVRPASPHLFRILVNYGLAARIPVVGIMFFAILGDWGTHYDGPPPNFAVENWFLEWLLTGLIPQLTFWVAYTVIVGGLFAGLTLFLVRRDRG